MRQLYLLHFPTGALNIPCASRTELLKDLRQYGGGTAAGSDGAINVYRDSVVWICELCRHRSVVDKQLLATKAEVAAWLKETWPKLGKVG